MTAETVCVRQDCGKPPTHPCHTDGGRGNWSIHRFALISARSDEKGIVRSVGEIIGYRVTDGRQIFEGNSRQDAINNGYYPSSKTGYNYGIFSQLLNVAGNHVNQPDVWLQVGCWQLQPLVAEHEPPDVADSGQRAKDAGQADALSSYAVEAITRELAACAQDLSTFSSDDVFERLPAGIRESLSARPNALGAAFTQAAKHNLIEFAGGTVRTKRPEGRKRAIRLWRRKG